MDTDIKKRTIGMIVILAFAFTGAYIRKNHTSPKENEQTTIRLQEKAKVKKEEAHSLKRGLSNNQAYASKKGDVPLRLSDIRENARLTDVTESEVERILDELSSYASAISDDSNLSLEERIDYFYKAEVVKNVAFEKKDMPEVYELGNWVSTYIGDSLKESNAINKENFNIHIKSISKKATDTWSKRKATKRGE